MIFEEVSFIILLTISSSAICHILIKNMNKETHKEQGKFIQKLLKINLIIQATVWPIMLLISIGIMILRSDYLWLVVKYDSVKYTLLYFVRPLVIYFRVYVSFNTLVIAACRYGFIVKNSKVSEFGMRKFKRIVLGLSFLMPFVLVLLLFMSGSNQGFINKGISYAYEQYSESNENITFTSSVSPSMSLAIVAHIDPLSYFISINFPVELTYFFKILAIVLLVVMSSNVVDAGLYYVIFRHFERYD